MYLFVCLFVCLCVCVFVTVGARVFVYVCVCVCLFRVMKLLARSLRVLLVKGTSGEPETGREMPEMEAWRGH